MNLAAPAAAAPPEPQAALRRALGLAAALYLAEQALLWALYWWPAPKALVGDEVLYLQRALGVARLAPLPEKLWLWPPLQHWFLGALFRLFGPHLVVAQLAQNLLLLASAGFLRALWRRLDGRAAAGDLAAALYLLNPSVLACAWWLWPEPLHLFLLLGALWLLACAPWQRLAAPLAGAAVGLAILAKSLLMPFWPAFALLWWRGGGRAVLVRSAAFALALGVVLAPMLWYGWRQTGAPLIADSSGFNLAGGLADRWRSDYIDDAVAPLFGRYLSAPGGPREKNAAMLAAARAQLQQHGLAPILAEQLGKQYFRLFSAKTLLVTQLPGRACAGYLGAYRLDPGALASALAFLAIAWHLLVLVCGALGIAAWRRWRDPLALWIGLFAAYQLALFLGLHVKARFLLPLLPFLGGFAASALLSLPRLRGSPAAPADASGDACVVASRPRWWFGAALAALLAFLALAGPLLDRSCG